MGQPAGFNWYFPGVYSVMVPYHDIQDFFYSGHISTALVFIYGLKILTKWYPDRWLYRLYYKVWVYFRIPYIWMQMIFTRTHFVIDMTGGVAMAGVAILIAERLCYIFDVILQGRPAHKRMLLYYEPCPACGWANRHALKLLDCAEKRDQGLVVRSKSISESSTDTHQKKEQKLK